MGIRKYRGCGWGGLGVPKSLGSWWVQMAESSELSVGVQEEGLQVMQCSDQSWPGGLWSHNSLTRHFPSLAEDGFLQTRAPPPPHAVLLTTRVSSGRLCFH